MHGAFDAVCRHITAECDSPRSARVLFFFLALNRSGNIWPFLICLTQISYEQRCNPFSRGTAQVCVTYTERQHTEPRAFQSLWPVCPPFSRLIAVLFPAPGYVGMEVCQVGTKVFIVWVQVYGLDMEIVPKIVHLLQCFFSFFFLINCLVCVCVCAWAPDTVRIKEIVPVSWLAGVSLKPVRWQCCLLTLLCAEDYYAEKYPFIFSQWGLFLMFTQPCVTFKQPNVARVPF